MAASQCPKCGHLFEVRDGSGEPLPLAHCPDCDAYYPAHVQSCKWCGTTLIPEKAHKGDSSRLRWVAGGTFAVAVVLGLFARDPSSKAASPSAPHSRASARPKIKPGAPAESLARVNSPVPADTAGASDSANATSAVLTDVSTPVLPAPAIGPAVIPQSVSAPSTVAAGRSVTPSRVTSTVSPRNRRPSSSWDHMVARHWVIVRADASHSAHIVASVGPNARVQLGESRGSWRRIKLRGIAGWVDVSGESFATVRSARSRSSSHIVSTARR